MNKISTSKPLILIGAGGHCISVIEAAESANFEIVGILDSADKIGSTVLGYEIIGTDNDIANLSSKYDFVITVGQIKNATIRMKIAAKIKAANGKLTTIIASTANVSKHAQLGAGTVVLHGAMLNAEVNIGENCIINTMANIEHGVKIGNFCHIAIGAVIAGDVIIHNNVFIGANATIIQGLNIGDNSVIGATSAIFKNIPPNTVVKASQNE